MEEKCSILDTLSVTFKWRWQLGSCCESGSEWRCLGQVYTQRPWSIDSHLNLAVSSVV